MAIVKKQVLGSLSGAIGDVVYRVADGKNIVCRRPRSFMPGTDRKSVERRLKFALAVKFARAIYSVPELKTLWQAASPERKRTYNFILRRALETVTPTGITDSAAITPPCSGGTEACGVTIACTSLSVTAEGICAGIEAVGVAGTSEGSIGEALPTGMLAFVISLTGPADKMSPEALFISGSSEARPLAPEKALAFDIALSGQDLKSIVNYSGGKIHLALLTLGDANEIACYSGTVASPLGPAA